MSVNSTSNSHGRGWGKQQTRVTKTSPVAHAKAAVFLATSLAAYEGRAVVVGKADTVIITVVDIVIAKEASGALRAF